jgi:hypothetical protein
MNGAFGGGPAGLVLRVAASAVAGGTAAELTGGRFANGAITAAFVRLFQEELTMGSQAGTKNAGSATSQGFNALSVVGNLIGKIWALPGTLIGTMVGLASLPFGAELHFGYNAIVFTNLPFGGGALTLGNTILSSDSFAILGTNIRTYYAREAGDAAAMEAFGFNRTGYGFHEMGHTFEWQLLGPLFPVFYLLSHPFSASSPFENAADRYGAGQGSWWP